MWINLFLSISLIVWNSHILNVENWNIWGLNSNTCIYHVMSYQLSHAHRDTNFLSITYDNVFFEEVKLTHPNWHQRESNLRPWGGAHSQVLSQYHQANPSGFTYDNVDFFNPPIIRQKNSDNLKLSRFGGR